MFKNPISPKVKEKKTKSPWNFEAPCYDERNFISGGDNYGTGFKQPVGREGGPKARAETLPYGRVKTMQSDNMREDKLDMYGKAKDAKY